VQLEDIEVTMSDYVKKTMVTSFQEDWDALGEEGEAVETFSLSTMKSLQGILSSLDTQISYQLSHRCSERNYKLSWNATY
jgi:hypothetical protein